MKTGRVYKIVHNQSDLCYIGSTFNELRRRFQGHKAAARCDKTTDCTITKYIKLHGVKNFNMILVKEYKVVDRQHLRAMEQLWINKLRCVNKFNSIPILWRNRYQANQFVKYYEANKERLLAQKAEKISCDNCGRKVRKSNMSQHKRTKRCMNHHDN